MDCASSGTSPESKGYRTVLQWLHQLTKNGDSAPTNVFFPPFLPHCSAVRGEACPGADIRGGWGKKASCGNGVGEPGSLIANVIMEL